MEELDAEASGGDVEAEYAGGGDGGVAVVRAVSGEGAWEL